MAQFEVYRNDGLYLIDCQADILHHLATRCVAPFFPLTSAIHPMNRLNPVFTIEGEQFMFMPQLMATVASSQLRRPVASFLDHRDTIMAALDMLLTGY